MSYDISIVERAFHEGTFEALNEALVAGYGTALIQVAETFHSRQFCCLADQIEKRLDTRLVLIAGPSSSGKTTTSKRLGINLKVLGINPIVIGMDDYFKNREDTPKDADGKLDFECLGALDVEFLNQQLNELFDGKEVNLPTFDFIQGKRRFDPERTVRMKKNDIIIMEGIHGLNPDLTPGIEPDRKFKIYASPIQAVTNGKLDHPDYFTRLLRRMVRDYQFRGHNPMATLERWASVRAGEEKNIFPYKNNADSYFDSALIYELPLFKSYVDTLLRSVPKDAGVYYETAQTILNDIFKEIASLTPKEIATIPSSSICREFIGGSVFED